MSKGCSVSEGVSTEEGLKHRGTDAGVSKGFSVREGVSKEEGLKHRGSTEISLRGRCATVLNPSGTERHSQRGSTNKSETET